VKQTLAVFHVKHLR